MTRKIIARCRYNTRSRWWGVGGGDRGELSCKFTLFTVFIQMTRRNAPLRGTYFGFGGNRVFFVSHTRSDIESTGIVQEVIELSLFELTENEVFNV